MKHVVRQPLLGYYPGTLTWSDFGDWAPIDAHHGCLILKWVAGTWLNPLRLGQNGRHFADIFKWIYLNENVRMSIANSWKFVPRGLINNILALVEKMAWRRLGDKPLSAPMMVTLLTHICASRPQWGLDANVIAVIPARVIGMPHRQPYKLR